MTDDISSYTYQVTTEVRQRLQAHISDTHDDNDDVPLINWDDTGRSERAKERDSRQGFLAEAIVDKYFDDIGISHDWDGGEGAVDFTIDTEDDEHTIDVKSRGSNCDYRNLIKDDKISTSDDVDIYLLTNVHYHPINKDLVTAVELVGYIRNDDISQAGEPVSLYGTDESKKWEVQPSELTPLCTLERLARLS
jgi:hypothetical protein